MKISAEERAIREALRPQTRARATKLMNEILKKQQEAAARGDNAQYRYFQEQITSVAGASADADHEAITRAETAWVKLQKEQLSEAEREIEAKKPVENPKAILDKARRLKAQGKANLDQIERARMKALKGE